MPRGRKGNDLAGKLLTDYMERMSGRAARKVDEETDPIESLKGLITKEFTTVELKKIRKDIHNIDSRLMVIETVDHIYEQNTLKLQEKFTVVKTRVDKGVQQAREAYASVKTFEKVLDVLDIDVAEIQSVVENADNLAKKNNIRLCGLKEGIEGIELSQYLEEAFTG